MKFPVLNRFHWVHLTMQFGRSAFLDGRGLALPHPPHIPRTTTIYKGWAASLEYCSVSKDEDNSPGEINNRSLEGK